jgi:hypothetical protein
VIWPGIAEELAAARGRVTCSDGPLYVTNATCARRSAEDASATKKTRSIGLTGRRQMPLPETFVRSYRFNVVTVLDDGCLCPQSNSRFVSGGFPTSVLG